MISLPKGESINFFRISSDTGSHPASRALWVTFGPSAIKIPFSGSCLLRSCASVKW